MLTTYGVGSVLILLSYLKALITVLGIASQEEQLKALNMCVFHVCVVPLVCPLVGASIIHDFRKHVPLVVPLPWPLIPPFLNSVFHRIKTCEICIHILGNLLKL